VHHARLGRGRADWQAASGQRNRNNRVANLALRSLEFLRKRRLPRCSLNPTMLSRNRKRSLRGINVEIFSEKDDDNATQPYGLPEPRGVKHIGIVLFDGFALQEAAAIVDVFQSVNALAESTRNGGTYYDTCLLSGGGGGIASSSSVFVWTESVEARRHFEALFVIGGEGVHKALCDERLVNWLRRANSHCELVSPVGEGRLLLEAAGFGQAASDLRYIERLRVITGNGPDAGFLTDSVSPLRAALKLVQADFGTEFTRQIVDCVSPPAEKLFSSLVPKNASIRVSKKIQASVQWLQENGDRPIAVDQAAQAAAMSERNFLRRFKMEIGVTPSDYLLYVRLDMSCRLLVETDLPIDKIARRCGIGCGGQLAKLFRKHLATTPTAYRESKGIPPISSDS